MHLFMFVCVCLPHTTTLTGMLACCYPVWFPFFFSGKIFLIILSLGQTHTTRQQYINTNGEKKVDKQQKLFLPIIARLLDLQRFFYVKHHPLPAPVPVLSPCGIPFLTNQVAFEFTAVSPFFRLLHSHSRDSLANTLTTGRPWKCGKDQPIWSATTRYCHPCTRTSAHRGQLKTASSLVEAR